MKPLARLVGAAISVAAFLAAAPAAAQGLQLPPGCQAAFPATCTYTPPVAWNTATVDRLLVDPARANHPIPVRIRYPIGANGPLPVVLWNHGGSTTRVVGVVPPGIPVTNGQMQSERRSTTFASAGYVVVHVGRLPVEDAALTNAQLLDCTRVGVTAAALLDGDPATTPREVCRSWIGWHLYGPQNVAYVASRLAALQATMPGDFSGSFDREKLVVGGWSGGTQSVMNIAGAGQRWDAVAPFVQGVTQPSVNVPGAVAFFADAPRRPAYILGTATDSGFRADELERIDARPFLFNSGKRDIGPDIAPSQARGLPWLSALPGGKLLAWDRSGTATHGTVDLGHDNGVYIEGCEAALGRDAFCRGYAQIGVAFLDAVVKAWAPARVWIASDAVKVLSAGELEMHRR